MPDVLGYARVSTDDQDVHDQRRRLNQANAIRIFEDVISGKRFERPGLMQLLDYARPRLSVCCTARPSWPPPSGTARSRRPPERKTNPLSILEEKINTSSAAGELIFYVFGAIAHFERRLIGERTKDGLAAARARRRRSG
mgnify:CR=1 FL=1